MALIENADYNQIVVCFNPETFQIVHIKARKHSPTSATPYSDQGILDRLIYARDESDEIVLDANDNPTYEMPGVYNTGIYDPDAPDDANDLEIDACIRAVMQRRLNPTADPAVGSALIYSFDENSKNNEVDVTLLELSDLHSYVIFMLLDPIHTAIRQREGQVVGVPFRVPTPRPTSVVNACVIGTLRKREVNPDD